MDETGCGEDLRNRGKSSAAGELLVRDQRRDRLVGGRRRMAGHSLLGDIVSFGSPLQRSKPDPANAFLRSLFGGSKLPVLSN
jgi:hypothetical protein